MNRPTAEQIDQSPRTLESKLSLLVVAMIGALISTSVLIAGDSVTVSSGETLPQVLLILLTALIASIAGWQILPLSNKSRVPLILLVLAIVSLLVSSCAATLRADGRSAWNWFWHIISLPMLAMLTARFTWRPALARALWHMLIMCAVFQSTFALHQYFISMPAYRAEYLRDPDAALLKADLVAPPGSEIRMQYESRLLGSYEPIGTFALTNTLAVLLSGVLVGLASIVIARRENTQLVSLWSARVIALLIVCAWLLTKSRSGYLGVGLVTIVALAMDRLHKSKAVASSEGNERSKASSMRWVGMALGLLLLIGLVVGLWSSDRLVLSEAPKSILYRLEYWQASAKMILDYPLTGVGFGNFQPYYAAYKLPAASEVIADPHNWLIDLAVNGSLPFLFATVLGLVWILRGAIARRHGFDQNFANESTVDDQAYVTAFWLGALVMFVLASLLQLLVGELISLDATVLGFVAAIGGWWILRSMPTSERAVRRAALLAVITMLVCLLSSGSWQASGIAIPMSVLLAIIHPGEAVTPLAPWTNRNASAMICVFVVASAFAAFVWQTWQPVQSSWALEQQAIAAWKQGRPDVAVAVTQQAIAADRIAASPRRMLAQFSVEEALAAARRASASDFAIGLTRVDTNLEELIAHDPISNLNYGYAGECNLSLAAACAAWNPQLASERVAKAAEYYRQATERYPTSVALHAQLGVVKAWIDLGHDDLGHNGNLSAAALRALDESVRLSELTPHANRKLESQQIFLPPPLSDRLETSVVRPSPDSPWAKAEPLTKNLRKLKQ